MTLSCSWSLF